jgi:hypothetical protein
MASAAQFTANQSNAQSSTGPRTPEGKARVSQNALRHGLTSRHLVIRPDEQEEFNTLQKSLLEDLNPQGALETVTFQELIHAAWTLHRLRRVEAEACTGGMSDFMDPAVTAILDRLSRYQSRAQRAYYKALAELRILQTNRALRQEKLTEEAQAVSPAASKTPVAASIQKLTKQTQSRAKTPPPDEPATSSWTANPVRALAEVLLRSASSRKSAA